MATPLSDTSLIPHILEIASLFVPVVGVIVGLVVWAWRSMEKNIDRLELTVREHSSHDIQVHDAIFTQIREVRDKGQEISEDLNRLLGEHDVQHGGH